MTALDRALAWFLEPPTPDGADTPGTQAAAGEPDATERRAPRTAWLRPCPRAAPVMTATLPVRRFIQPSVRDEVSTHLDWIIEH